jgi:hypothetical protein
VPALGKQRGLFKLFWKAREGRGCLRGVLDRVMSPVWANRRRRATRNEHLGREWNVTVLHKAAWADHVTRGSAGVCYMYIHVHTKIMLGVRIENGTLKRHTLTVTAAEKGQRLPPIPPSPTPFLNHNTPLTKRSVLVVFCFPVTVTAPVPVPGARITPQAGEAGESDTNARLKGRKTRTGIPGLRFLGPLARLCCTGNGRRAGLRSGTRQVAHRGAHRAHHPQIPLSTSTFIVHPLSPVRGVAAGMPGSWLGWPLWRAAATASVAAAAAARLASTQLARDGAVVRARHALGMKLNTQLAGPTPVPPTT